MAVGKKSSAVTFLLPVVACRYDPRDPRAGRAHHPSRSRRARPHLVGVAS